MASVAITFYRGIMHIPSFHLGSLVVPYFCVYVICFARVLQDANLVLWVLLMCILLFQRCWVRMLCLIDMYSDDIVFALWSAFAKKILLLFLFVVYSCFPSS